MSRIGKLPVQLNNAKVEEKDEFYEVVGPKGTISVPKIEGIKLTIGDTLQVELERGGKEMYAKWGLLRSLLNNAVIGVNEGYEKRLDMVGVGYRANVAGKNLVVNAGYSHPVEFPIPEGIDISVEENTKIIVKGFDKHLVGQTAANIKKIRKPEPYKGKGIKYEGEHIRRKAGKSGKAVA